MSRDKDAELAEEIKALEIKEGAEEVVEETEKPVAPEDESWKKRYGDLRSHAQKQEDALKLRIKALEESVAAVKEVKTPKTKEEILDWRNKFPDVFDIVKTIAMEEVEDTRKKYDEKFAELDEREANMARQSAFQKVVKAHPDFPELINSEEFQAWLDDDKTPEWAKHALQVNDTDHTIAIDAVDFYKLKHTKKTKKEPDPDTREAARTIKSPSSDAPSGGQNEWSETRLEALSKRDYEKYADEIDIAIRAGKFTYDISGGAR
jgi:hypothetical protein